MEKKILVINSDWPSDLLVNYGVEKLNVLKKLNFPGRVIRAIYKKLEFTERHLWDKKEWWNECRGYHIIILLDSSKDSVYQSKMIEKVVSPNTRLVFFMLNPISYTHNCNLISNSWEKWSFSKKESIENGCKYGETFYFKEFVEVKNISKVRYDSFFIGLDKGRLKYLNELKAKYEKEKLVSLFYIVDNKRALYSKGFHSRMPYSKVVNLILLSKSITDVVQEGQEGMTLRVMESIFFKRKLITNNRNIKFRDIYKSDNIFILGQDDDNNLLDFVNAPYIELEKEEVEKYEFSSWLNRIINNAEFK
jgi:hypothetical protein